MKTFFILIVRYLYLPVVFVKLVNDGIFIDQIEIYQTGRCVFPAD